MGPGAVFVKRDLADAFRHIPVSASDWWLLEFLRYDFIGLKGFRLFGCVLRHLFLIVFTKVIH